ncbi:MAG: hypothetical protein LBS74_06975 [Oscillospiraceae bacterium]|jgi:hypothetical protein|nr:hypothetical protein [Oscillospiraceae bacterium]
MQEMIERIVEMDKKARDMDEEAERLKERAVEKIEKKKQAIRTDYLQRARRKLQDMREEEAQSNQVLVEQSLRDYQALSNSMNDIYNKNKNAWVNEIFARVTGR